MVRASGICLEGPGFNPQSGHLFCLTQTPSPRESRTEWKKKTNVAITSFILKPWAVGALVWVSSLPDFFDMMVLRFRRRQLCEQNISERDLATFFDRYRPSACTAFKYAASSDEFDDQIQLICTNISLSELRKIMHKADTLTLDNELSHQIFVIAPKPDSPCFKHCVQFASPFIANLLYMPFTSNLLLKPRSSAAFSFQHCS